MAINLAGGDARTKTLPASGTALVLLVVLGFLTRGGLRSAVALSAVWGVGAVGLDVFSGYVGEPNFGQGGLVAIGAYGASWARTHHHGGLWALILAVVAGAVGAGVLGLAVVRLAHFGAAVTTFFAGFLIMSVAQSTMAGAITHSEAGINVPSLALGGHALRGEAVYYLDVGCLAVVLLLSGILASGATGRKWRQVKNNPLIATAMGVDSRTTKLTAFMYCGACAGLSGYLLAPALGVVTPEVFSQQQSILLFAMVVVGGMGSLGGAVLGALLFELVSYFGAGYGQGAALIFDAVFLGFLVGFPAGIYGGIETMVGAVWPATRRRARLLVRGATRAGAVAGRGPRPPETVAGRREVAAVAPGSRDHGAGEAGQLALSVTNLRVEFGGVVALNGVSLSVAPGEIHGVIGPNGAGKTTLTNAVCGLVACRTGEILVEGTRISDVRPSRRSYHGLARTFQHVALAPDLSAVESVGLGTETGRWRVSSRWAVGIRRGVRKSTPQQLRPGDWASRARSALELVGIPAGDWETKPSSLGATEQKLVDLARASAGNPAVVLLDEPTAGLDPGEAARVAKVIRIMQASGVAILLIAHDVPFVRDLCDRITMLDFGRVVATGVAGEVLADPAVVKAYLGSTA